MFIQCTKCKQQKDNYQKRSNGSLYRQCIDCRKELIKNHYNKNKKSYSERAKAARKKFEKTLNELKNNPCKDCGFSYPYWIMQFDHLDPKTKTSNISRMRGRITNIDKLLEEVAKCELVCANCHADRTYKRAHNIS